MRASFHEHLPLAPLLHAYTRAGRASIAELHRLPDLGTRFAAVLAASAKFLTPSSLDALADAELAECLARFYAATVAPPLHADTVRRRAGIVRHALAYLLRGRDSLPLKVDACLRPGGPYHVAGLGPSFWSALLQGLQPARHPAWTPATVAGLRRLGLIEPTASAGPGAVYGQLVAAYARIQTLEPSLTALHVDHFLTLVAAMKGRSLDNWTTRAAPPCPVAAALSRLRSQKPLRDLLKERGPLLHEAAERLEAGLTAQNGKEIGLALALADPAGSARSAFDWGRHAEELTLWVSRLWEADDPFALLNAFWQADPLPGAGLWLPAAVLHLRDAQHFYPWDEDSRQGFATLDDSADSAGAAAEGYRLFNAGTAWLRQQHGLHPLEVPGLLRALVPERAAERDRNHPQSAIRNPQFQGFCADTFHFLGELGYNNRRDWMERQRARYRFAVREPLIELCRALAERYVEVVLRGVHGWELVHDARSGRALTSICKNAFGRTQPYNTTLWIAFCRRSAAGRREEVQLFVRLDADGLRYGLRLGRKARSALRLLRRNVQHHGELLFLALRDSGALAECRFGPAESPAPIGRIDSADALVEWVGGRSLEASRTIAAGAPLLAGDDLIGEVLLTFDRLLPLYACAVEADARSFLLGRLGPVEAGGCCTEDSFRRATHLGGDWLRRARELLELKRQLILQGVPGTGKTHVARSLARLLTGGRDDRVRLVQFHPAYSYEEFVEGIKVRSVEMEGRHDVTYPVEDGLLCAFAAEAERHPAQPYVLLIDEINRGNLPRIFGELLYLLEYRGQAVELPCSRRRFCLPPNLYVLATMNAADRSVALIDQALRRRFSFLEMQPDAGVLASWLSVHVPAAGPAFAGRVRTLFERLNARLRADLGPQAQVGHSYFMVHGLDEARLRMVWQHHVAPLLEEHFAAQPARLEAYDLDRLLADEPRRPGRRRPAAPLGRVTDA